MNTMNCEEARELLPAYGDGELDLPHALALEKHLDGCADCTAALRSQRTLNQAVRSVTYHRAPDALRARLRAQLPLEPAGGAVRQPRPCPQHSRAGAATGRAGPCPSPPAWRWRWG